MVVQYGQIMKKYDSCVIHGRYRLVHGEELYDIVADREQKNNLAAKEPAVLKTMRAYYDAWWAEVEPHIKDFVPVSIGSKQQPVVELTSGDWESIYADNTGHVMSAVGGPTGGHWNIQVEQAGEYEFTLRRWPEQTKAPLGSKYIAKGASLNKNPKLVVADFPTIAQAKISIAGLNAQAKADPTATGAVIAAKLPAGRTTFKAWFADAQGKDLCGAFFVTVRRK
jgi:hypothetical protein